METKPTTEAEQYARTIAEEVRALDILLSGAEDDSEEVAEAVARLEMNGRELCEGFDAFALWINERALEVVALSNRDRDRFRLEILRTVGGPRCEITRDSNDGHTVTVSVWWGGETAHLPMTAPSLADILDEIAEAQA